MTDGSNLRSEAADGERGDVAPADSGRAEKRSPHSIRFLDPEWERIEAYAETRGLTGPEFVRFAALAAMEAAPPRSAAGDRLAPLIEMTFRATYIHGHENARRDARRRPQGRAGRTRRRRPRAAGRDTGRRTGRKKRVDEGGSPQGGAGKWGSGCRQERNLRPAACNPFMQGRRDTRASSSPVVRVGNEAEIHPPAAAHRRSANTVPGCLFPGRPGAPR